MAFKVNLENQMHLGPASSMMSREGGLSPWGNQTSPLGRAGTAQCDPLAFVFIVPGLCGQSAQAKQA